MPDFDDARLEDIRLLERDEPLRRLAEAGARVRIESAQTDFSSITDLGNRYRPRAVIASGPESRLIRAVLEPHCPVPFVAWPTHALPAWVGALDLVLVLTGLTYDQDVSNTIAEAARRGAQVLVACPEGSPIAEQAAGRNTTVVPTRTSDPLAAAVVLLEALNRIGLGPVVQPVRVADAMDEVAEACSPFANIGVNPAKDLAISLADDLPLVWGGTVLAARASRRIAEAFRDASGRPALAAEAAELVPVIQGAKERDPFADPFDTFGDDRCTSLIMLDDDSSDRVVEKTRRWLVSTAEGRDVRIRTIRHDEGNDVERYVCLLQHGLFGAAYLALGLGRTE